jgi:hypothetical protein
MCLVKSFHDKRTRFGACTPESREGEFSALTSAQAAQDGARLGPVAPHPAQLRQSLDDTFAFTASQPLSPSLLINGVAGGHGVAFPFGSRRSANWWVRPGGTT